MSYSSTPNRSLVGDDYLPQRVGHLSLQNEFGDSMYGAPSSDPYESHGDPMGGQWEYQTPGNRNMDTIVAELTPEEVRWFYKTEGEKRWLEFSGYDSYRIEMRYREMFFNKQDFGSKYSSYSAFSDVSGMSSSQFGASSIRFPSKQPGASTSGYRYQDSSQSGLHQHKIVVRGGLYDVNFDTMQCASIYWPGEECSISRGTWFYEGTWQPLDREQSTVLENKHLQMFQGRKMSEYGDSESKGTPVHTETFPDFIVEWFSPAQVYLYSENKPSKIVRSVTSRLGFHKSTGYRLFRGYKTEASLDDRPDVEINHLVFVIHGIGQKMDTGRIIRNTSSLRDCVSWLKQKYFMNYPHHRAEFFPVEWRSNLQLDGELVDAITPNTLQSLRQMLNASAMDIMYYTSPLYGGEVQRGLREELNRLYSMFSARNPYFMNKGGKISVIAHSLGCVILYDIIMGLKPGSLVNNAQQGLLFQIQNFFCLGSPLAVFLALRWKDSQIPGKLSSILPPRLCHRLYNVFHPTDPVAYRIEPLLVKEYYRIAPLVIQPYNATCHIPYAEMPLEMQGPDQTTTSEGRNDLNLSHQTQPLPLTQPISPGRALSNFLGENEICDEVIVPDRSWSIWGLMNRPKRGQDPLDFLQEGLDYRLDYILRESNLGVSYLSALTSHTAYWTNYDIAYFILTQIFPDLELGGTAISSDIMDRPPQEQYSEYHDSSYNQPPQQQFTLNQPFQGSTGQQHQPHQQFSGPSNQPYQPQQQQQPPPQPHFQQQYQPPFQQNQPMHQQQMGRNPHQQQMQQHPQQQPQKMGLFDRATGVMDFKQQQQQQHASSPTKGTKSFFPSFNLSSLTSPVKNLSNSLSNISNQMTNMAAQSVQPIQQHQQHPGQPQQPHPQQQRGGFMGGMNPQNKQNFNQNFGPQQQQMHGPNQQGFDPSMNQHQNQQNFGPGMFPNQQQQNAQHYGAQQHHGPSQHNFSPSSQQSYGQPHPPQQQNYNTDQHGFQGQTMQLGLRSGSPYGMQRSASPQTVQAQQNRGMGGSLQQFGPLETPTGIVKPKMTRIQPKVPTGFPQTGEMSIPGMSGITGMSTASGAGRGRCVSPLGQSKVVCSRGSLPVSLPGSLPSSLPTLPGYSALGGRSLSSGNLRHSSVVSGGYATYAGRTAASSLLPASSPTSSLSRRTMSRPNLNSSSPSALGMSSLVYNSGYTSSFGGKSFLNRDFIGPSSR